MATFGRSVVCSSQGRSEIQLRDGAHASLKPAHPYLGNLIPGPRARTMTPPITHQCRPAALALRRRLLRRVGRDAQRPHGLRGGRRRPGALPRSRRHGRAGLQCAGAGRASSACWRRPACVATPGMPSSPRATSRCATSPRRATSACTGWGRAGATYALYVRLGSRRRRSPRPRPSSARACNNDRTETVEDYRGLIEEGVALEPTLRLRQS